MTQDTSPSQNKEERELPKSAYYWTFAALTGLLLLTVGCAALPLGTLNAPVALTIGAAKGVLIAVYFMHLRVGRPLLRLAAGGVLLWIAILFALSLSDYFARLRFQLPLL